MKEVYEREVRRAEGEPGRRPPAVSMGFIVDPGRDQRRYNAPAANEVAVVFVGDEGRPPDNIDLIVHDRNPGPGEHALQTMTWGSRHADPMLYPLFFPHGETGWHFNLRQEGVRRNRVRNRNTIRQFACYRLAVRYEGNNDTRHVNFSLIHGGGFLLQQYVCDLYVRMEANNMHYIRNNQARLFADEYQGLRDHVNQQLDVVAGEPDVDLGRRIILPSTFTGSPRYMKQCYHDAMAIVRKYGKPDVFITFTCNPGWPEIRNNLANGYAANDRPDLVSRVFHAKLQQLMTDVRDNRLFGIVDAFVYTVEFQKRGLPHAHILVILQEEYKFRTAEDIDQCVLAVLPDPLDQQRLHRIVVSHMIHGPCGVLNPNSPCMENAECSKRFPKPYAEETVFRSEGGYPAYRRPDDGRTALVRGHEVGNEFVVPYNPYLLAKYNGHINVEVCSTVKSVKYLYKYVYKGHDAATLAVWDRNEVEG